MNDSALLAAVPTFIAIGGMLKATPQAESGRRIVYFEASNELRDIQNEIVAAKALADSAGYFKKYEVIDIDHRTMLGRKPGIPDYQSFEIGGPSMSGRSTARPS